MFNNIYCCKKHSKETNHDIISKELEYKNLKSKGIKEIKEILTNNNIEFNLKHSKILILEEIEKKLQEKFVLPYANTIKTSEVSLIDIGISMKEKLNELYDNINIDVIIIENQISPIANRMKTLQGMIAQYFIMKNVTNIVFVSASNKLKEFNMKNSTYNERKSKGIEVCDDILINNSNFSNYYNKFMESKKKDDLADCFLQGLWYLKDKKIICETI